VTASLEFGERTLTAAGPAPTLAESQTVKAERNLTSMTRTLRAGGAWRAALVGALALAAAVLAALTTNAPRADAAFTTGQCLGADVLGRGASFARDAHQVFRLYFTNTFCQSSGTAPAADYDPAGSGAGRRAVGERTGANSDGSQARNQTPRFGMTDEPPSPAGAQQMNQGTNAQGDEGQIHLIPAAVGAVTPVVNFPDNCDVNQLAAGDKTPEQNLDGDATPDDVVRVRFTKAKYEAAFAKDPTADNWTELFPQLTGPGCNKPVIRVVRFDSSGTTFTHKDYLDRINGARDWIPTFTAARSPGLDREWPNAVFGARADCAGQQGPGSQDDAVDQLTSGCANGNGPLVAKLLATDGSIGYSDLSTARTAGLAITPEANDNDTYFTQVPNGAGGASTSGPLPANQFTEPTADPNGFRTDGQNGSNCQSTQFTGVPSSTLGDWSAASGVNSATGFGVCTLTYGLLFDDYKSAYALQPDQAGEERKARTVKDYWNAIVSDGGQAVLFGKDYGPLPGPILALARGGVTAVGWDKGGGGGPGPTPPVTPPVTPPGPGPGPPPAGPSNRFQIVRVVLRSRTGGGRLDVRVPGGGTIALLVKARSGRKTITVDKARVTVSKSGSYKVFLKPGSAAMRILRKRGKLSVSARVTYTPRGGQPRSTSRGLTLRFTRGVRR